VAPTLILNQRLDGYLCLFFALLMWVVILEMLRISSRKLRGLPVPANSEAPFTATRLDAATLSRAH
jgi:carbon starvation protein